MTYGMRCSGFSLHLMSWAYLGSMEYRYFWLRERCLNDVLTNPNEHRAIPNGSRRNLDWDLGVGTFACVWLEGLKNFFIIAVLLKKTKILLVNWQNRRTFAPQKT